MASNLPKAFYPFTSNLQNSPQPYPTSTSTVLITHNHCRLHRGKVAAQSSPHVFAGQGLSQQTRHPRALVVFGEQMAYKFVRRGFEVCGVQRGNSVGDG